MLKKIKIDFFFLKKKKDIIKYCRSYIQKMSNKPAQNIEIKWIQDKNKNVFNRKQVVSQFMGFFIITTSSLYGIQRKENTFFVEK